MKSEHYFRPALFDDLHLGELFFHDLDDQTWSPAIKVALPDIGLSVLDLNYLNKENRREAHLTNPDTFAATTVIHVPKTDFQIPSLTNTRRSSDPSVIPLGAAVMIGNNICIRTRYNKAPLYVSVTTGGVVMLDSPKQGLWSDEWKITVKGDDGPITLFERLPATV